MDNDPKSYRVPILSLKDVLDDESDENGNTQEKKSTRKSKETSSETVPVQYIEEYEEDSPQISEDDIASAVITPTVKDDFIVEEKPEPEIREEIALPEAGDEIQEKVVIDVEKPLENKTKEKEVSTVETPTEKKSEKVAEPAVEKPVEKTEPHIVEKIVITKPSTREPDIEKESKPHHLPQHITIEKIETGETEIHLKEHVAKATTTLPEPEAKKDTEIKKPIVEVQKNIIENEPKVIAFKPSEEKKEYASEPVIKKEVTSVKKQDVDVLQKVQQSFTEQTKDQKHIDVKPPLPPVEKVSAQSEQEDEVAPSNTLLSPEKTLQQENSKQTPQENVLPKTQDTDDDDSIFSLIEDSVASENTQGTPKNESKPEPIAFIEKKEVPKTIPSKPTLPKTPVPDPLDIWERDAAKPRVPYSKKITIPKPPVVEEKENEEAPRVMPSPIEELQIKQKESIKEEIQKTNIPKPSVVEEKENEEAPKVMPHPVEDMSEKKEIVGEIKTVDPDKEGTVENDDSKEVADISQENLSENKEHQIETEEKTDVSKTGVQFPLQRITKKESPQETVEENKIGASVSNLSALRDRILKENAEQSLSQNSDPETDLAKKRQIDLVQTDIQNLNETTKKLENDTSLENTSTAERARPVSKHAQAVADIADRLHSMAENTETNVEDAMIMSPDDIDVSLTPDTPAPGALVENAPDESFKALESSVPLMRTFRLDAEQAVNQNRTSVVNMISAEEKRRETDGSIRHASHQTTSSWSYVFIGASMILVIGAIAIGAFLFFRFMTKEPSDIIPERIPINETISYEVTNQTRDEIMSGLVGVRDALHSNLGSITEIQLTERKNKDEEEASTKISFVTTSSFLQKIESHAPGSLIRSIDDTMVLGVHELRKNEPFLVFSALTYDQAYKGMFEWESSMNKDLSPLFGISFEAISEAEYALLYKKTLTFESNTASSSGIQTEQKIPSTAPTALFEDVVVANIPVRGLKNTSGETVLMWAMPDNVTIVVTTNETTMRTLLEYMTARSF